MKFEFFESEMGANVRMVPETMEEVNGLARMALNAKAEKPQIDMLFSGNQPEANIWVNKVKKTAQKNSIGK